MAKSDNQLPRARKHRIFLVEDHPVTREGFAQLINYQSDLSVCGQADTAARALTGLSEARPDLAVVDISLVESNGIELIKQIQVRFPGLPVLVLSTHDESLYAERSLRAGARGYVMKQAPTNEVMKAIRQVLQGGLYISESMRIKLVAQHLQAGASTRKSAVETLSDRELEVFELIGHGQTTRHIAGQLHLSVSTVETYRAHIKQKLQLTNAMDLVRSAVEWVNSQRS